MGLPECSGFTVRCDFFSDHRMTDEITGHAFGLHQRGLEGEKREHVVDILRHLFGPTGAPCPDRRSYVMHGTDRRHGLNPLGHAEREIGAVDGDHHIGLGVHDGLRRLVDPCHQ